MLVNATCEGAGPARPLPTCSRATSCFGLRDRVVVEIGETPVNGRAAAAHRCCEGRCDGRTVAVRGATWCKGDRCVYDLLYVAPPDAFDAGRARLPSASSRASLGAER